MKRLWTIIGLIIIAVAMLCAFCGLFGCASMPVQNGILNFGIVAPGIARGGDPLPAGWAWLVANGYTNVINLAPECSDAIPIKLRMNVQDFFMTTEQQIFGPVEPQIRGAAAAMTAGTFIHCQHGANRTGTVVWLYDMQHGLSWSSAKKRADAYGWESSFSALRAFCDGLNQPLTNAP